MTADDRRFELIGPEPTRFGLGGRRLSPFVGRDLEMRFLLERFERARNGLGQVVWVTGEPGVGKSRLLFEFAQRVELLGVPVFEARCPSHGADLPYCLLHDLLRSAWELPDDPVALIAVVPARLEALRIGDRRSADVLAAWLGAAIETPSTAGGESLRQRLFDLVRTVLFATAGSGVCVLLLEDVHWIDRGSAEFVAGLVDHVAASRLFVVLSARPGHTLPMLDRSFVSRLALPPLTRDDSETLARAVRPTAAHVITQLVDRAEGNPFFLEELLWAVPDAASGAVPDTVGTALMARMDRLNERQRRVLETAAVLGREVQPSLLSAMLPDQSDVVGILDSLMTLELFHVRPGPVYVFKHALTEEVAYRRLALGEARRLHAAAGRALEAQAPHRIEELAYQWDRTDEHSKAIDYALRFAEHATARYALAEAVAALQRALSHCDALPAGADRDRRTVTTAMQVAVPLTLLGRTREIADVLTPRLPVVERLGDAHLSAPFFLALSLAADHTADHEAAEQYGTRAVEEARQYGDRVTEGRAFVMLSFSSWWTSEHRLGVDRARRAAACLELPAEAFWRGHALFVESQLLLLLAELDPARKAADALRRIGEAVNDRRLNAYGRTCGAMERLMRGDVAPALRGARDALEMATDPLARATVLGYLGEIELQAGAADEARASITAALEFVRAAHFGQLEAWDLARLAEIDLVAGDFAGAERLAGDAAQLADRIGFRYVRGRADRVRGEAKGARGAVQDAIGHFQSALENFEAIETPYEWARTMLSLSVVQVTRGDADAGHRSREQALNTAKRIGAHLPTPSLRGR